MKTKFVAEFAYGSPRLSKVEMIKETEKTISINETKVEKILGWTYLPSRLAKDSYHIFDTPELAINYLMERALVHIEGLRKQITETEKYLTVLDELQVTK